MSINESIIYSSILSLENEQLKMKLYTLDKKSISDNIPMIHEYKKNMEYLKQQLESNNTDYDILSAENDRLVSEIEDFNVFLANQLNINFDASSDMSQKKEAIKQYIYKNNDDIKYYQYDLEELRDINKKLEMTTQEKATELVETMAKISTKIDSQIYEIDTELEMYAQSKADEVENPLKLEDFITLYDYNLNQKVNTKFIPFFKYISEMLHDNVSDFEESNNPDIIYHTYLIVILKFMQIYSKRYIRQFIDEVYIKCENAIKSRENIIRLPNLILPQTLQTNSLYFLMNRYNSKVYQPDRVLDFGDFLYNFMKPEFRSDTTQALNLFQASLGKRYNSIAIYSDETIESLRKQRKTLSSLL